jgi:adenylate cyclase class 2
MNYEVEMKFHCPDSAGVVERLRALGARELGEARQSDAYFNHPSRDFARTDEALRLRDDGGALLITYKGPKLDAETKTRREIEIPFGRGREDMQEMTEILLSLGFHLVAHIRKARRRFELSRGTIAFEASIDRVEGVGEFVELETASGALGLENARAELRALAGALGLVESERRSYLELLLAGLAERP